MVLGYFQGFEHNHKQKNSSTPMDKIAKIRSQPVSVSPGENSVQQNFSCRKHVKALIHHHIFSPGLTFQSSRTDKSPFINKETCYIKFFGIFLYFYDLKKFCFLFSFSPREQIYICSALKINKKIYEYFKNGLLPILSCATFHSYATAGVSPK